jgi:predicted nucleic acid-binding protein
MEPAFWDSSSLVPLCVKQSGTPAAQALSQRFSMLVWWAAPVEIRGASARLLRMGQITSSEHVGAQVRLDELRSKWREVSPEQPLRDQAERLIDRFPLKAADALQLAAALVWCSGRPGARAFISGDAQLREAARQLGFQVFQS